MVEWGVLTEMEIRAVAHSPVGTRCAGTKADSSATSPDEPGRGTYGAG
jgi:hypothetical protein